MFINLILELQHTRENVLVHFIVRDNIMKATIKDSHWQRVTHGSVFQSINHHVQLAQFSVSAHQVLPVDSFGLVIE